MLAHGDGAGEGEGEGEADSNALHSTAHSPRPAKNYSMKQVLTAFCILVLTLTLIRDRFTDTERFQLTPTTQNDDIHLRQKYEERRGYGPYEAIMQRLDTFKARGYSHQPIGIVNYDRLSAYKKQFIYASVHIIEIRYDHTKPDPQQQVHIDEYYGIEQLLTGKPYGR